MRLPKNRYITLSDILIKDENGTHQIDHVVISQSGIFVIEVKNYYGLIKGSEHSSFWTQYLGKNKYQFLNPIHQNYGHIEALSNLLDIPKEEFISIICFSNQARLSIQCNTTIVNIDSLFEAVKKIHIQYRNYDIEKVKNTLLNNNICNKKTRREHIKNIKKKKYATQSVKCPKCHGKLIIKKGKYGEFLSCENYPRCKYTCSKDN